MPELYLISLIKVNPTLATPLYRQIYDAFRQAILKRLLAPGTKLPSSRDLANLLKVSRNTVVNAVDQLVAEGYVQTRVGAGIFVASELPEALLGVPPIQPGGTFPQHSKVRLSHQGRLFVAPTPQWFQRDAICQPARTRRYFLSASRSMAMISSLLTGFH